MRIFDKNRMVSITMREWDNRYNSATPDWSLDFFNAGSLKYDEERDAYRVGDVQYCIDQANDWAQAEGDFHDDEVPEYIERQVYVDE